MYRLSIILLLLFCGISSGCQTIVPENIGEIVAEPKIESFSSPDEIREIDYAVYAAILNFEYARRIESSFVISGVTGKGECWRNIEDFKKRFDGFNSEAIEDYCGKNQKSYSLTAQFPFDKDYQLIVKKDSEDLAKSIDHEKLGKKYGAHYTFSRVGFSQDHKAAVVRLEYLYCGLCSWSAYFSLKFEDSEWVVENKEIGMIS